jgi:hypothetical protein
MIKKLCFSLLAERVPEWQRGETASGFAGSEAFATPTAY